MITTTLSSYPERIHVAESYLQGECGEFVCLAAGPNLLQAISDSRIGVIEATRKYKTEK